MISAAPIVNNRSQLHINGHGKSNKDIADLINTALLELICKKINRFIVFQVLIVIQKSQRLMSLYFSRHY